jgi:hypothetical protein
VAATAERRRELSLLKRRRETPDGCWEWTGSIGLQGYGQYRTEETSLYVHRVAYELYVGRIPDEMVLHHTCHNRRCFNPTHLKPTTRANHLRIHRCPAWEEE